MDNSRVGEGVAYSETSRWKAVSFRKTNAKEIAQAIVVNWPQDVQDSTSLIMGSAERIEENVFASAKDEADYKLKIRIWIRSLDTSSMVPRHKPSTTSCNISEAASSSDVDWQEVLYQKEKKSLLEEIKEVKMLLFDTNVVFNEADIIPSVGAGASELIVELCFTGVTVSLDLMFHLVSNQMSIKPLRLRIPTNYPNSSPILLDEMPPKSRDEPTNLSTKAKLKLQLSLRSLDDPLSIKSIAMSWEKCVREVLCDYAHKFGGGTFSSKYGGWKNV